MERIELELSHDQDIDEAQDMIDVLNGIYYFVARYGWKLGHRNNMSVDISIALACFRDKQEIIDLYDLVYGPILDVYDRSDFSERFYNIKEYLSEYIQWPAEYMTDFHHWKSLARYAYGPFFMKVND